MNRDQAIARIKAIEPAIHALGASAVYLFGSTARNEASPTSDVDIFVDRYPGRLGFDEYFDLAELLESTLGTKVDLATREALHSVIKNDIERTAIRIL